MCHSSERKSMTTFKEEVSHGAEAMRMRRDWHESGIGRQVLFMS